LTSEKPTAAILNNKLHIVVRGITLASNDLYQGTVDLGDGAFSGWTPLQGSTPSAPVLATTHLTNELFLAVRGEDNVIYLKNWNGITWDATWTPLPSGSTGFSPAIAVYGNNLQIVVIGMDGISLWHNSMDINTNALSTWTPLSGSSPSAPTMTR